MSLLLNQQRVNKENLHLINLNDEVFSLDVLR